jgi:hypothetical protein
MEEASEQKNLAKFRITETAHSVGINCRHFGKLRKHIKEPEFRSAILLEIVARCIKNNLRWKLREKMKQIALPLEEPYRRLVIDYLNLVFGNTKNSDEYWDTWLKKDVENNFSHSLTDEEKASSYHLKLRRKDGDIDSDFLYDLLMRVTKMTGMKFNFTDRSTTIHIFASPEPLDDTDLRQLENVLNI